MVRVPSLTKKYLHKFEIQEIIRLYKAGKPMKVISIDFNVSSRQMTNLLRGHKNEI